MKFDTSAILGELVTYHATDGVELQGFLVKSKRRTGRVVVNIHGMTGSFFRSATQKRMIPHYLAAGYDFFLINTRGHGTITPMYKVKGKKVKWVQIGTALEKFEDCTKDLKGVVDFLCARGYRKIILQGHSTGCQKATYYMYKTKDRRISAVVLLAPADDYNNVDKKELGKRWKPAVSYAKRLLRKNPNELMSRKLTREIVSFQRFLSKNDLSRVEARLFNYESGNFKEFRSMVLPVMAVFGSNEEYKTKPVKIYLKQLAKVTRSKKFEAAEISGADHAFKSHEAETAKKVIKWLNGVI